MDGATFDVLAKSLTAATSRRRTLTGLLVGTLGLLGLADPDEAWSAKSGTCKPKCGECENCDKGTCKKTNNGKKCKKGKCTPKANGTACSGDGTCQGGVCSVSFCTGKNSCAAGNAPTTCQASGPNQCLCTVTDTGAPFCALIGVVTVTDCPANPCPAGETCINANGGNCGRGGTQCAQPCPNPL